jgi:signal peptidase II
MQKGQGNRSPGELGGHKIADFVDDDKSKVSIVGHSAKLRLFLSVVALVVVLDQLSKLWIRANSPRIELLPGFLDLIYVENYGSAFGLFANQTFLIIAISLVSLLIILLFLRHLSPATILSMVSIALILGGAIGNLIDRLRFGYVTDFIDIHLQNLFHWPAFNIADAAITVGILTLLFSFYKSGVFKRAYEHSPKPKE